MVANTEFPFSTRQLLEGLPPERSSAEIREKYRDLIAECVGEYAKAHDAGFLHFDKLSELTISLARDLASRFGRLLEWSNDLIPCFDLQPVEPRPLYATRSVSSSRPGTMGLCESYSFEKFGHECSAKIGLEVTESNLDLIISLHGDDGEMLLPFDLTITDRDSDQALLEGKEFLTGSARIRGLERGAYVIRCEQGRRVCEFAVTVK